MFNNILDIKNRSSGRPGVPPSVLGEKSVQTNKSLTLLWGATGEQEWTPALTTGELNIIGQYVQLYCLCLSIGALGTVLLYWCWSGDLDLMVL